MSDQVALFRPCLAEPSGSVGRVLYWGSEGCCLAGSSLIPGRVSVLCPWARHFISHLVLVQQRKTYSGKVSKGAKIRNPYNQVPHLTQDTNGKETKSHLDTTKESQEVSPFPAGDHKAHIKRRAQRHSKHTTEKKKIYKRSTILERSVKYFTGGLNTVSRCQPHP